MGRVFQRRLTATAFLAITVGEGITIAQNPLAPRQEALPISQPLVAIQINGNILGTIAANVNLSIYTPPLIDTLSAIVSSAGTASTDLIGGVLGGAGGLLNVTVESVRDILTPSLTPFLSVGRF